MFRSSRSKAFTLVEVLIVVVIMAVLAATIIPTFTDASGEAKISSGKTNVSTLRSLIALYKSQHSSGFPPNTGAIPFESSLTKKSKSDHTIDATGAYGPYVQDFPVDPFANAKAVAVSTDNPIVVPANTTTGGYIYNSLTGEIRYNYNTTQFPAASY